MIITFELDWPNEPGLKWHCRSYWPALLMSAHNVQAGHCKYLRFQFLSSFSVFSQIF